MNTTSDKSRNNGNQRRIPFFVPDVGEEEIARVADVIRSGWLTTGPRVNELERKLAEYIGIERVNCLSSQTACAEMTLRILCVGPGDEVITSAYTYTATAEVIRHVGAEIVLVDTQPDGFEMDYDALEEAITPRTKVVIPVDLAGVPCDYERIFQVVERKKDMFRPNGWLQESFGRVTVMADAAHSLGSVRNGVRTGRLADVSAFSLHAVKNLTTAEGGAVCWKPHNGIDTERLWKQYRTMSLHGQSKDALDKSRTGAWEYDVLDIGYKCNMTDLAAALGLGQLGRYEASMERRREIIRRYDGALRPYGVWSLAHEGQDYVSNGHLYLSRIPGINEAERNSVIAGMSERGISCNVHFKPLPMLTAYRSLGFDISDYPNAYGMYRSEISLPMYVGMTAADADYVSENYLECVRKYL